MNRIQPYEMDDRDFDGPTREDIFWGSVPLSERELAERMAERPGPEGSLWTGLAVAAGLTGFVAVLGAIAVFVAALVRGVL